MGLGPGEGMAVSGGRRAKVWAVRLVARSSA